MPSKTFVWFKKKLPDHFKNRDPDEILRNITGCGFEVFKNQSRIQPWMLDQSFFYGSVSDYNVRSETLLFVLIQIFKINKIKHTNKAHNEI